MCLLLEELIQWMCTALAHTYMGKLNVLNDHLDVGFLVICVSHMNMGTRTSNYVVTSVTDLIMVERMPYWKHLQKSS